MTVADWIGAALDVVQIVVIAGGVVWGYYKFVRGRTFARRAELTLAGELLQSAEHCAIRVDATMRNTGTSDIALRAKVVYVRSVAATGWADRPQRWEKRAAVKLFEDHAWIEAHETIEDHFLIPIDTGRDVLAYQLEARAYEGRKEGGGIKWTARTVIPVGLQPLSVNEEEPLWHNQAVETSPAALTEEVVR